MKRYTLFIVGLFLCLGTTKAQSSVDTQIAVNDSKQDKTFVVIISNENYKHEEAVPFAKNDGEVHLASRKIISDSHLMPHWVK